MHPSGKAAEKHLILPRTVCEIFRLRSPYREAQDAEAVFVYKFPDYPGTYVLFFLYITSSQVGGSSPEEVCTTYQAAGIC